MDSKNFWFGKNVLITGGNGFVASNLAIKLIRLGANIHVTVNHYSEHSKIKMLSGGDTGYDTEVTNMFNYDDVKRIIDRHRIDTIYHLAANAIVSNAASSPAATLNNNIIPTINILESARISKIPRIIVASTDKSYGDHTDAKDLKDGGEPLPYRENYALRGLDVYSTSKACVDMICQAFALQYKQHIIVTRCSNIYGQGDLNFSRIIPRTILRLLSGKQPVINEGNENVLREYMHIDDIVNGYLFLAENTDYYYKKEYPNRGDESYGWPCFNLGSYNSDTDKELTGRAAANLPNIKSTADVMAMITDILAEKKYIRKRIEPIINKKSGNFVEIPDQYLDSKKIMDLGYKAEIELRRGLCSTADWYYKNYEFLKKLGASYLE